MLIILDRDGVINYDSKEFVKSADEWIPIPGSIEAIAELKKAGHTIVIATNQSGIGRGLFNNNDLEKMHAKLKKLLTEKNAEIDGIYFCPHHPDDNCQCRKPKTGMLEQIQKDFSADMTKAWMIGDSLKDIQVGLAMGCNVALVKTGNGLSTLKSDFDFSNVCIVDDLASFVANL